MKTNSRNRTFLLAATAAAGVLSLAACGSNDTKTTSADHSVSAAASGSSDQGQASSSGDDSKSSKSDTGKTTDGVKQQSAKTSGGSAREVRSDCTTDDFTGARLVAKGQEMNSIYYDLQLTGNKATCHVQGFPGLSLLDAQGHQIGKAASRSQEGDNKAITLKPGQVLHAQVKTPDEGVTDGKCDAKAAKIKVYPPNNTAAVTGTGTSGIRVCGDSFQVTAVSATATTS
ncbi:DUF4232 domain-containing protein [Streptomyces sp. NPDC054757]